MSIRFRKTQTILGCALSAVLLAPVANASTLIGAYLPSDGWNSGETLTFNSLSHKSLGFQTVFSAFNHSWDQLYWQSTSINEAGAVPMVSWMPVDLSRPEDNLLPEIAAGTWDWYIDNWASGLKGWAESSSSSVTPMIYLRFAHEFNGNWYPYSNSPDELITAWRKIHDRFVALEVDQYIEWVWNANNVNVDNFDDITAYYPGNEYVDWTSIDGYNWGTNYTWTNWEDFSTVFADTYETLTLNYPDKPIMIAEFGSTEQSDTPDASKYQFGDNSDASENKEVWMQDSFTVIEELYPSIKALGLFNIDKELSWSITNSSSTGLAGWNNGLASAHFVSSLPAETYANLPSAEMDDSETTTGSSKGKSGNPKGAKPAKTGKPKSTVPHADEFETIALSQKEKKKLENAEKRRAAAEKSKARKNRIRKNMKNFNVAEKARLKASKMSVINY